MSLDFTEFFKKYEAIIGEADKVFETVKAQSGDRVRCKEGCSDCCHALFDLTLIEALYVNHHFNSAYSGLERSRILDRADEADRAVHKFKRDMFKASQAGTSTEDILREAARAKVRCPLLDDDDLCALYARRPVTCRIYGVPTAIGGAAHTCGRSGFEPGGKYPTVFLDKLQDRLYLLSHELATAIGSRYRELGAVLVPLSMALLTSYDEEYLGLAAPKVEPKPDFSAALLKEPVKDEACGSCDKDSSACASCKEKSFSITIGGPDAGGKED
ncbi:MAG TPA: YkgJ family cysteine cluster protein [Desulfovibrio sp.]|uniref:YkgJ family cysteine cluster protein n=1 Tax=Desulfovibrio sp. TaxID=885 RepID=UPI002C65DA11|nr:YkgJ family cysteine cluster protein [Desulfovibrio sp.]HMM38984.1 YkgJ family cysteine cluster protein [Desulfovibrio sp.]